MKNNWVQPKLQCHISWTRLETTCTEIGSGLPFQVAVSVVQRWFCSYSCMIRCHYTCPDIGCDCTHLISVYQMITYDLTRKWKSHPSLNASPFIGLRSTTAFSIQKKKKKLLFQSNIKFKPVRYRVYRIMHTERLLHTKCFTPMPGDEEPFHLIFVQPILSRS